MFRWGLQTNKHHWEAPSCSYDLGNLIGARAMGECEAAH